MATHRLGFVLMWFLFLTGCVYGGLETGQWNPPSRSLLEGNINEFLTLIPEPCTMSLKFPNITKRSPSNVLGPNMTSIGDAIDMRIFRYYKADGYEIPIISSPGINHCGGKYPVYFKDNSPKTYFDKNPYLNKRQGKEFFRAKRNALYQEPFDYHVQTACMDTEAGNCHYEFDMVVLYCTREDNYVYGHFTYFPNNVSYCLSERSSLKVRIPEPVNEGGQCKYKFQCHMDDYEADKWYTISWYLNDNFIKSFTSMLGTSDIIDKTIISEDELGITKPGFSMYCMYNMSLTQDGPVNDTVRSSRKTIDLQIVTRKLNLYEGQTRQVILEPTVPLGCASDVLTVNINSLTTNTTSSSDSCTPATTFSTCGVTITSSQWDQPINFTVSSEPPTRFITSSSVSKIQLVTDAFPTHPLWQNYDLGTVEISTGFNTQQLQERSCYAVCDPHMKTFQGQRYEHQIGGQFILYKNDLHQQEIQVKTEPCLTGRDSAPYCVCGAAVRVGKEVYNIDKCDSKDFWAIGHTQCSSTGYSLLDIKVSGNKYQIRFPSGTLFETEIYQSGRFLNVYVYPSAIDSVARGLCGTLGDNRYLLRNGSPGTKDGRDVPDFSESWRVTQGDIDLFSSQIENLQAISLETEEVGGLFCQCSTSPDTNKPEFKCERSTETCTINIEGYKSVKKCQISDLTQPQTRRKRSALKHVLVKRGRPPAPALTWRDGWTEANATAFCDELFQNSSIVQTCKSIPNLDLSGPRSNCILDIQFAADTSFALAAVDTILSNCLHEVKSNPVFQTAPTGQTSILEQVSMVAKCPSDCSLRGECVNQSCICETGYGGKDCSVLLTVRPTLNRIENNGLCDHQVAGCKEATIYGGVFLDGVTQCRAEESILGQEATKILSLNTRVESISEVVCTLPERRLKRAMDNTMPAKGSVHVYNISISNDGSSYSSGQWFVVYNSICQTCNINSDSVSCQTKRDYCVSGEDCYTNGQDHSSRKCYKCTIEGNSFSWKRSKDGDCGMQDDVDNVPMIIGIVLGVVALIIIIIVVALCVRKRNRENSVM